MPVVGANTGNNHFTCSTHVFNMCTAARAHTHTSLQPGSGQKRWHGGSRAEAEQDITGQACACHVLPMCAGVKNGAPRQNGCCSYHTLTMHCVKFFLSSNIQFNLMTPKLYYTETEKNISLSNLFTPRRTKHTSIILLLSHLFSTLKSTKSYFLIEELLHPLESFWLPFSEPFTAPQYSF